MYGLWLCGFGDVERKSATLNRLSTISLNVCNTNHICDNDNNNNLMNFHKSHESHSGPMFSTELYTSLKIIEKDTLQMACHFSTKQKKNFSFFSPIQIISAYKLQITHSFDIKYILLLHWIDADAVALFVTYVYNMRTRRTVNIEHI